MSQKRAQADAALAAAERLMDIVPEGTLTPSARIYREVDLRMPPGQGWGAICVDVDGRTASLRMYNIPMKKVVRIAEILTENGGENGR